MLIFYYKFNAKLKTNVTYINSHFENSFGLYKIIVAHNNRFI